VTYLDRELLLIRMTNALRPLVGLDLITARLARYEAERIPSEAIIELDRTAVRLERVRRDLFSRKLEAAS
jgi:hypothetical protein